MLMYLVATTSFSFMLLLWVWVATSVIFISLYQTPLCFHATAIISSLPQRMRNVAEIASPHISPTFFPRFPQVSPRFSLPGHLQVADLLLSKGMNLEETDPSGWTPLVWATKQGDCTTWGVGNPRDFRWVLKNMDGLRCWTTWWFWDDFKLAMVLMVWDSPNILSHVWSWKDIPVFASFQLISKPVLPSLIIFIHLFIHVHPFSSLSWSIFAFLFELTGHQALARHLLEQGASLHWDHEGNSPLLWPLISGGAAGAIEAMA